MNIAVFGAGGFIGSHLSLHLNSLGHKILAIDRNKTAIEQLRNANRSIAVLDLDFTKVIDWTKVLENVDVVIHLISTTVPKTSNDNIEFDINSNLISSIKLFSACNEMSIHKVIFASSGGTIYGNPTTQRIQESHPTNPICSYGIVKLTIEKYLNLYRTIYGLDSVILRMANAYGPGQEIKESQALIPRLVDNVLRDKPIEIWGDGSVVRDFVYIDDVVKAFEAALDQNSDERIFNIGSGKGVMINEILDILSELTGKIVNIKYMESRNFDVSHNVLDNSLAREYLNWEPKTNFHSGLKKVIETFSRQ